jgi:lauroyl/myristoyl acyltransferase
MRFCISLLQRSLSTALHYKSFVDLIQQVLGESRQQSIAVLKGWVLHTVVSRFNWIRLANKGPTSVNSRHSELTFLDMKRVVSYLNSHRQGLIIATIHMGDYLNALFTLSRSVSGDRQVFVVRNKAWSSEEEKLISRFQSNQLSVTIIRHDVAAARKVIRELRKGSVIILLFDLSESWGATTTVRFLGRPMELVRGPAELALVGRADILPVMCHFNSQCTSVAEAFPIIRPARSANHQLIESTQQITQRLVDIADRHIRKHPEQWHHWQLVPQMLAHPTPGSIEPEISYPG